MSSYDKSGFLVFHVIPSLDYFKRIIHLISVNRMTRELIDVSRVSLYVRVVFRD